MFQVSGDVTATSCKDCKGVTDREKKRSIRSLGKEVMLALLTHISWFPPKNLQRFGPKVELN